MLARKQKNLTVCLISSHVFSLILKTPQMVNNRQSRNCNYLFLLDPDPFTHMKKAEGGDEVDMSFLKELEEQEQDDQQQSEQNNRTKK